MFIPSELKFIVSPYAIYNPFYIYIELGFNRNTNFNITKNFFILKSSKRNANWEPNRVTVLHVILAFEKFILINITFYTKTT